MLGSRKLLIVLCIVPCILSLVCIGAFAAPADDLTPSVDIPIESEVVEDVVKSPSAVAEETFPAQPLLESSYYTYGPLGYTSLPLSSSNAINAYSVSVFNSDGSYVAGASGDVSSFYVNYESGFGCYFVFDGTKYIFTRDVNEVTSFNFYFTSPNSTISDRGGQSISGTLVEESLIPDIADSVFDLGDALITFIVSSWVVMIPLAAWLVVLCIGAIRKLVKGV